MLPSSFKLLSWYETTILISTEMVTLCSGSKNQNSELLRTREREMRDSNYYIYTAKRSPCTLLQPTERVFFLFNGHVVGPSRSAEINKSKNKQLSSLLDCYQMATDPSARLKQAAFEYENLLLKAGQLVRPDSFDHAHNSPSARNQSPQKYHYTFDM